MGKYCFIVGFVDIHVISFLLSRYEVAPRDTESQNNDDDDSEVINKNR